MKKFLSYALGVIVLFSLGATQASAILPDFEPVIIPLDCSVFGTCAVYVNDESYVGPADGSKSAYFQSITAAVNYIKGNDEYNTIIIADGTYSVADTSETFPFEFDENDSWKLESVNILGGYSNDFEDRDYETYRTLIDVEDTAIGAFHVENLGGKVSGVEITGVSGSGGAPIFIDNTGGTSYNFVVEFNTLDGNSMGLGASGILVEATGSNTADVYGNEITDGTGALNSAMSVSGNVEAYENYLHLNSTWSTMACNDGALVYNNFLLLNDAQRVINTWGDCDAYHNTVVGNDITAGNEYAAVVMSGDNNNVANNLIAGNAGNQSFVHNSGDTSTFEYNALYDNGSDPDEGSLTDGNVLCDPDFDGITFNSPEDAMLGEGSDCIDVGKSISAVTDDYFGSSRPLDGDGENAAEYDPGAYEAPEYVAPAPTGSAPAITGLSVSPATFSPDGDSVKDETVISFNISDNADVTVTILNASDVELTKLLDTDPKSAGSVLVSWDGENDLNQVVEDGTYTVKVDISNTDGDDSEEVDVDVDTSGDSGCGGYTDVPASHPSCDAIEFVQSTGAMTGNPDGTFAPEDELQRDQIAKIVLETFGLFNGSSDYCGGTDPFPDVTSSAWAYQYICRGVDLGMITGYEGGADAGYYRPARSVNRVEFLALTLRNLSDTMPALTAESYNDVEPNQWYSGFAAYSKDNQLFTGGNLYPSQFTKRVEVAEIIYELHTQGKI